MVQQIARRKRREGSLQQQVIAQWQAWSWLPPAADLEAVAIFVDGSSELAGASGAARPAGGWGLVVLGVARLGQARVFGLVGATGAALQCSGTTLSPPLSLFVPRHR